MFGEAFVNYYNNDENFFETGFIGLDDSIRGITKGSIITIGSRPGVGKTSFAISICNHLLEMDKRVLFCAICSSVLTMERQFISVKTKIPQPIAPVIEKKRKKNGKRL